MENFDTLMEQARDIGVIRNTVVQQWLEWRSDDPDLQQEPLDDYIEKMRFLRKNVVNADKRDGGWIVEIDELDCYRVGQEQGWRCAITGDVLEFTRGGQDFMGKWCNPKTCTTDRIDPEDCYRIGNIQLVTWEANLFKQGFTMRELVELSVKMIQHRGIILPAG